MIYLLYKGDIQVVMSTCYLRKQFFIHKQMNNHINVTNFDHLRSVMHGRCKSDDPMLLTNCKVVVDGIHNFRT